MVRCGTCLLVLGSVTACNAVFGIDELYFETSTGGAGTGSITQSAVTSSTMASTTGSGASGGHPGTGGGGGSCSYAASVLADAPVGYLRLGENSGTVVVDQVSSETGNYSDSGATLGQPGAVGCDSDTAVAFDGVVGQAYLGARFDFAEGASFTLEAWVNVGLLDDQYRPIISKEFQGSFQQRNGYFLWVHGSDGLGFEFVTTSMSDVAQQFTVPTGSWMHVVGTYDGFEACLYLNTTLQMCEPIENQLVANNGPFRIGAFSIGSDHFDGLVDEVAVYDKVLDKSRIDAHFAVAKP